MTRLEIANEIDRLLNSGASLLHILQGLVSREGIEENLEDNQRDVIYALRNLLQKADLNGQPPSHTSDVHKLVRRGLKLQGIDINEDLEVIGVEAEDEYVIINFDYESY